MTYKDFKKRASGPTVPVELLPTTELFPMTEPFLPPASATTTLPVPSTTTLPAPSALPATPKFPVPTSTPGFNPPVPKYTRPWIPPTRLSADPILGIITGAGYGEYGGDTHYKDPDIGGAFARSSHVDRKGGFLGIGGENQLKTYTPDMSAADKLQLFKEKTEDAAHYADGNRLGQAVDYIHDFFTNHGWAPSTFENKPGTWLNDRKQKALDSEYVDASIKSFAKNLTMDDIVAYASTIGPAARNGQMPDDYKYIAQKAAPQIVQQGWNLLKQNFFTNLPKAMSAFFYMKDMPQAAEFMGNPAAFYGLLATTVLGGAALLGSGGSSSDDDEDDVVEKRLRKAMKRIPYA